MVIASFVVVFRETLEAAIVVGIILSYLYKIKQTKYNKLVYLGVLAGIVASIIVALLFVQLASGFEGVGEAVFEGTAMLVAAILISYMILWMLKQKHKLRSNTEKRIQIAIDKGEKFELFFLPFIAVFREGVETVIFLGAITFAGAKSIAIGGAAGLISAALLGYLIFVAAKKVNLKIFFKVTSIVLILLAAGLVAHGVHEFQEVGFLPVVVEEVWNTNAVVDEDGAGGSLLRSLLGYSSTPSLLEILAYLAYIALIALLWRKFS